LSGNLRFLVYGNSTLQLNTAQSVSLSSYTKVALLYKNDVFKIYINGAERYNVSGSYTMPTNLNKINFSRSGASIFFGKCKTVAVFKEALSDTELACLTSINNREIFLNFYYRMQYVGSNTEALSCAEQTFNI